MSAVPAGIALDGASPSMASSLKPASSGIASPSGVLASSPPSLGSQGASAAPAQESPSSLAQSSTPLSSASVPSHAVGPAPPAADSSAASVTVASTDSAIRGVPSSAFASPGASVPHTVDVSSASGPLSTIRSVAPPEVTPVSSSPGTLIQSAQIASSEQSAAPQSSAFASAIPSSTPSTRPSKGRQADPPPVTSTEVAPTSVASSTIKASSAPLSLTASRSQIADPVAPPTTSQASGVFSSVAPAIPTTMVRSPGGPGSSAAASSSPAPVSGVKVNPNEPSSTSAASEVSSQPAHSSSVSDVRSSVAAPAPAPSSSENVKPSSSPIPSANAGPSSEAPSSRATIPVSTQNSAPPAASSKAQPPVVSGSSALASAAPSASSKQQPSSAVAHNGGLQEPTSSIQSSPSAGATSSTAFSKPNANQANAQSAATTSTITDHPDTTLSKPVVISTTDSKGHTTVTIPPVVTSLAVSTQANGNLVTFTHVEANPTGVWVIGDDATGNSFFNHGGAVAGVFVVVGLVVAAIAAVTAFFLCKRRNRRRIRHSISRPLPQPDNPFEDPRATPSPTQMRYAGSDSSHRNLIGSGVGVERGQRNLLDDEFAGAPTAPPRSHPPSVRSSTDRHETTLAGVGAGGRSMGRPAYDAPLLFSSQSIGYTPSSPNHQYRPSYGSSVGLAVTNDDVHGFARSTPRHIKRASATPSAAPSTPSIYPATLPGGEEDISTESTSSHAPATPSTTELPPLPLAKPPRPPRRRPVAGLPPRNPVHAADQASKLLIHTQLAPVDARIMSRRSYGSSSPSASTGSDSGHSPSSESPATPGSAFSAPSMYPATPAPAAFSPPSIYSATPATVYSPPSVYPDTPENPFSDYNQFMSGAPPSPTAKMRENFYTRRKLLRKPSLEWKPKELADR